MTKEQNFNAEDQVDQTTEFEKNPHTEASADTQASNDQSSSEQSQTTDNEQVVAESQTSAEPAKELSPEEKLELELTNLLKSLKPVDGFTKADEYGARVKTLAEIHQFIANHQELFTPEKIQEVFTQYIKPYVLSLKPENLSFLSDPKLAETLEARLEMRKGQISSLKGELHRAKREVEKATKYANEKAVKNVVKPLIQNLVTASEHLPKNTGNAEFDAFREALVKYDADFRKNLAEHGVVIFGKVGDDFDANMHDAVSAMSAPEDELRMKIAMVTAEGFKLHDRVIVPATVIIFM